MDEIKLATQEMQAIIFHLGRILPLYLDASLDQPWTSRWNGVIELEDIAFHRGVIRPDGSIGILLPVWRAGGAVRYRTLIHEALHSFSPLRSPRQYQEYLGWEEGVVEKLQRLLRQQLLGHFGIPESDFLPDDLIHPFNEYISLLEELRANTSLAAEAFYVRLLHLPVEQRLDAVRVWRPAPDGGRDILLIRAQAQLRRKLHGF